MMLHIENNPWLGLYSYQQSDAASFFGRDREIQSLYTHIKANYCTFIYGKSGIGKTSLINAGLLPRLESDDYLPISIKFEHNTDCSYVDQIITKITDALRENQCDVEHLATVNSSLSDSAKLWLFVHGNIFWTTNNRPIIPVVFIDQFEEIFTLSENASRTREFFLILNELFQPLAPDEIVDVLEKNNLRVSFKEHANFRIIFSMREDFLARLEDYSYDISILRQNRVGIAPLTGNQALEVILKPYPEIIDRRAALKIIASITDDNNVSDTPEYLDAIKIDTCILSLFCSQLYKKAVETKRDRISLNLINQSGFDIIREYYKESTEGISTIAINYLEDKLLTNSGYRNSLAYEDVVPEYASAKEIEQLEQTRIIRKEVVNKIERIEFSHDVLCGVAMITKDYNKTRREREETNKVFFKRLAWFFGEFFLLFYILLHLTTSSFDEYAHWTTYLVLRVIVPIVLICTSKMRLSAVYNNIKSETYTFVQILLSILPLLVLNNLETFFMKSDMLLWFAISGIYIMVWGMYNIYFINKEVTFTEAIKLAYRTDLWDKDKENFLGLYLLFYRLVFLWVVVILGVNVLTITKLTALILLIPALVYVCKPSALKNIKVYLWTIPGAIILLLWFYCQFWDPILNIGKIEISRNICFFYLPMVLLGFVVQRIICMLIPKEKNKFTVRVLLSTLGVFLIVCLFSCVCGYRVLNPIFMQNVSIHKIGIVDDNIKEKYIVVENMTHKKIVLAKAGRLIFPDEYDHVSDYARTLDGYMQIEADGKIVSTADYLEYNNYYTRTKVFENYVRSSKGIISSIEKFVGKRRIKSGDSMLERIIVDFCRSNDALLLVDPEYNLKIAKHYLGNNKNIVYASFMQAVQLQLAMDATDKVLTEAALDSTLLSKQSILIYTIVYLKTGYVCADFEEFYHSYIENNPDYLNYIKTIVVDVKLNDFGEQIIDKGIVDKELLQELSSDKYQNIIKQRNIAKHIKLLKMRTNSL